MLPSDVGWCGRMAKRATSEAVSIHGVDTIISGIAALATSLTVRADRSRSEIQRSSEAIRRTRHAESEGLPDALNPFSGGGRDPEQRERPVEPDRRAVGDDLDLT